MHLVLLSLVLGSVTGKPIGLSFDGADNRTNDVVVDQLTDNFVMFEPIYTSRNLRGLFSEDDGTSTVFRQSGSLDADISMVGQGGQVAYITEIMFGDQGPFKAVIDTGSSDTWLVSKDFRCLDTDLQKIDNGKCKLGPGYSASSSFKQDMNLHFAIQYGDGEKLLGAVGTETVHVGSLGVETRVNVVDNAAWNGDSFSSGLLGLGLPANTANYRGTREKDISQPVTYDPFFTSAMKQGAVPAGYFALALQRESSGIDRGYLSFGGIPPVKTYGPVVSVRFAPPKNTARAPGQQTEYTVVLDGFKFPGSDAVPSARVSGEEGLIDSGTSVLLAQPAVARAYNAKWDPATQEPPPFSVLIGGQEFPIDPRDIKLKTPNGFASAVMPSRKTILGDTFMRNTLSVFDLARGEMRFASTNPAAEQKK